jgi:hypothetical protein
MQNFYNGVSAPNPASYAPAPERPNSGSAMKLAQQLRRLTMFASAAGAQHDGKRE